MTYSDFAAAAGGLLGFWLGLDFKYLVNIIFTSAMWLVGLWIKKLKLPGGKSEVQTTETKNQSLQIVSKFLNIDFVKQPLVLNIKLLIESLFWTAIYILFGYLSIQSCFNYVDQIVNSPTDSNFQKVSNNPITFPVRTFCVPFDTSAFDEPKINLEEVFVYMKEFNITILNEKFQWPLSLLRIVQLYLAMVDAYKSMDEGDMRITWSHFSNASELEYYQLPGQDKENQQLSSFSADVNSFANSLEKFKIPERELLEKFRNELSQIVFVNISKYNWQNQSPFVKSVPVDEIALVTNRKVCYKIPIGAIAFSSQYEYISFDYKIVRALRHGINITPFFLMN